MKNDLPLKCRLKTVAAVKSFERAAVRSLCISEVLDVVKKQDEERRQDSSSRRT